MLIFEKLSHSVTEHHQVLYFLPNHLGYLNDWINTSVKIHISSQTTCLGCHKITRIQKGYCWPCSKKLARCDLCFLQPYRCHFFEGTCREPSWAQNVCFEPHIVYCALSSDLKVGISRASQLKTRWIDQGATWAKPLVQVRSRREAGLIEKAMSQHYGWKEQTQWRDLIKGIKLRSPQECSQFADDFLQNKMALILEQLDINPLPLETETAHEFQYPVNQYASQAISIKLTENTIFEGILTGIVGQYLLFGNQGALNARAYSGFNFNINR